MINLIRKLFIKDYENVKDQKVREKHGTVASIGGIITNIILASIKIIIGIIACSMSIISDGINNLTDLFSCIVSLVGFKIASKPADEDHPYGHERVEYVTGMIISFIIIAVGIILGYEAVLTLVNGDPGTNFELVSFIVLGISIIGKFLLGLFYDGMGKAIDSVSLRASKQDSFNDAISTTAVLIAAIVCYFTDWWWLDPVMSIGIALLILWSGIKLIRETVSPLIGLTPDSDFVKQIINDVLNYEGVLGIHDIVVHSYGPSKVFITIHVEVDGYANVMDLHDIIDNIEAELNKKYGIELTIHMDPIDTRNKEIPLIKEVILNTIKEIDEKITFHDLRLVAGPTHTNVLFDLVLPLGSKLNKDDVVNKIKTNIKKLDKKYFTVIKVDNNYCH